MFALRLLRIQGSGHVYCKKKMYARVLPHSVVFIISDSNILQSELYNATIILKYYVMQNRYIRGSFKIKSMQAKEA